MRKMVLTPILKVTTGLRVSDEDQAKGLDVVYWGIESDVEPHAETPKASASQAA